jgi:phenylacetate-CoA ligase
MLSPYEKLKSAAWFLKMKEVSRDEIAAFRRSQLKKVISHAHETVPYYNRLFRENGIRPRHIKNETDLNIIPITRKKDIQNLPLKDLISRSCKPENLICRLTHGSTGVPFIVRRTWFEERLLQAGRRRAYQYLGVRARDRKADILSPVIAQPKDRRYLHTFFQFLGLYRESFVSPYLTPERILSLIRKINPDVLCGYPNVLAEIGSLADGPTNGFKGPRLILSGGDVLSPLIRKRMEETFKAPVCDVYGAHEFNLIGWECRETGAFHVSDDTIIVEVVNEHKPALEGEEGTLIGTNLHAFAMPFIRYALEDIVTKGADSCECGKPFSTIYAVKGRVVDYFRIPGKGVIHPYRIVERALDVPWIRQYHIQQEKGGEVRIYIVSNRRPPDIELKTIETRAAEAMANRVRCKAFLVEDIEDISSEKDAKLRNYRSLAHPS